MKKDPKNPNENVLKNSGFQKPIPKYLKMNFDDLFIYNMRQHEH